MRTAHRVVPLLLGLTAWTAFATAPDQSAGVDMDALMEPAQESGAVDAQVPSGAAGAVSIDDLMGGSVQDAVVTGPVLAPNGEPAVEAPAGGEIGFDDIYAGREKNRIDGIKRTLAAKGRDIEERCRCAFEQFSCFEADSYRYDQLNQYLSQVDANYESDMDQVCMAFASNLQGQTSDDERILRRYLENSDVILNNMARLESGYQEVLSTLDSKEREITAKIERQQREQQQANSGGFNWGKFAGLATGTLIGASMGDMTGADTVNLLGKAALDSLSGVEGVDNFNQGIEEIAQVSLDPVSDDEFWQGIQATQDSTMASIRAAEHAAEKAREAERLERLAQQVSVVQDRMTIIVQACARNGGRFNPDTDRCEPLGPAPTQNSTAWEAEKQNCLNAGKTWNGSSCDVSSTIVVHGWENGNRAYVQQSGQSAPAGMLTSTGGRGVLKTDGSRIDPGGPNGRGGSIDDLMDSSSGGPPPTSNQLAGVIKMPGSDSRPPSWPGHSGGESAPGGGAGGGSGADRQGKRLITVFTDEESRFSWKTQERACEKAQQRAIEKAKADCREQFGGRMARQSEISVYAEVSMCHSYRQMEKSGFYSVEGEWKASSKTSIQCVLPDVPVANPVAPSTG